MFLFIVHKMGFAIDVLFLQSIVSSDLGVEGLAYQSNNRRAGAKRLILITSRFNSRKLVVNFADVVALKVL